MDQDLEEAPGGARVVVGNVNSSGQVIPTRSKETQNHHNNPMIKRQPQRHNNNNNEETEPFLLLGVDLSHLSREKQYIVVATCLFSFSLLYGYLQELLSVEIFSRKLALFLSVVQFAGYVVLVYGLREYVYPKHSKKFDSYQNEHTTTTTTLQHSKKNADLVPYQFYWTISLLRAFELGLTNLAMQYINFPAKTLLKSSRVVFTMVLGILVQQKSYSWSDYGIVSGMVCGLAIFLHADAKSAAVFHFLGVAMLILSLVCDGVIVNISETVMSRYKIGQDEFIFRVYSLALMAVTLAAAANGDLDEGFLWISVPGTYNEFINNVPEEKRTWSVPGKILVLLLFCISGFLALSCCACITKNFGALTMSVTSTVRKATTLFISFFMFNHVFHAGHMLGIIIFISSVVLKILKKHEPRLLKRKLSGTIETETRNGNASACNETNSQQTHSKENSNLTLRHGGAGATGE